MSLQEIADKSLSTLRSIYAISMVNLKDGGSLLINHGPYLEGVWQVSGRNLASEWYDVLSRG